MRRPKPKTREPDDLYRARLSQQLDMRHPLVQLAGLITWQEFERSSARCITRAAGGRASRSG